MIPLTHRTQGYRLLSGRGLEIGALHEPAALPAGASAEYLDAITEAQAAELFKEVPADRLVHVTYLGDLDQDGLKPFPEGVFDFVILNHVLEHVANPVKTVREVFRICRRGGTVILSVPDKDYTFDRNRALTPWEHLWDDYTRDVRENSDEHYVDFLRAAAPHVFTEPPAHLAVHVQRCRARREHAHVWSSASFGEFLRAAFPALGITARPRFISIAAENKIECFSTWTKG